MIPAIAAVSPDVASASTLIPWVLTPTARAAFSFDPVARIQAPSGVNDTTTWARITTTKATMISTGTPPTVPAIPEKPNGRDGLTASGLM